MSAGSRKARSPSKFTIAQVIRQPGMKGALVVPAKANPAPAQGTNHIGRIRLGKKTAALLPTFAAVYGER